VVAACALVVVLGILITHYLVQRRIKDRLISLVNVCRDYAGGDRTVRVSVNGDDEFAMLAMALNTLLDAQGNNMSNAAPVSASGDAAALQAQIEKLLQEVSAVGDGDLRVQAEVTPDTLGVLADSFNYMIEELAKVVGRVQATAVQVTNATRRILDRSAELAQASEAQVEQISQTSKAVEALATFIQDVAQNALLSAETAQEALRDATKGQQAVRQTIEGMMAIRENVQETSKKIKRLGERSNEISEIVRIIDDIADQTNLLALNAAIQSAMAGEHGRGFAVVADEIRLLAERSTESTKRIATLVKSIQGDTYEAVVAMEDSTQEVVKGSQLADEAGRALNSIYSAVERQTQMIEGIARAANDQTAVADAVAAAMARISEIIRQTDAGTQEAAVSVSYLAELSEQLRSSVSTFRLPDHISEMANANIFGPVTSVTELSTGSQPYPALNSGDTAWNQQQSFDNFPPLPEPGNSGSLVALSSRQGQGQFAFDNQQDFGQPFSLGNAGGASTPGWRQPAFGPAGNQQFASGASGFSNGNGQSFGGQQGFGMPGMQSFGQGDYGQNFAGPANQNFGGAGGQQDFGFVDFGNSRFDNLPASGNNGQQGFATYPSFGSPNQAFPQQGNVPSFPPASTDQSFGQGATGMPNGTSAPSRPRWQAGQSQTQGQTNFDRNG
jgi:methyl-accepting chemotaxis protein